MPWIFLATAALASSPIAQVDREKAGDWSMWDRTDNNVGKREVSAMNIFLEGKEYVHFTMVCDDGHPVFVVDWENVQFPDQAVLTIGPIAKMNSDETDDRQYIFEKSTAYPTRGLRASVATSQSIIDAIGDAPFTVFTAHVPGQIHSAGIKTAGTKTAWDRVKRHCPATSMPMPPL